MRPFGGTLEVPDGCVRFCPHLGNAKVVVLGCCGIKTGAEPRSVLVVKCVLCYLGTLVAKYMHFGFRPRYLEIEVLRPKGVLILNPRGFVIRASSQS